MRGFLLLMPLLAACSSSYLQQATPEGKPGPQEAKVVFCRPSRLVGSSINFPVWDEQRLIGYSEGGTWFEYRCPPGNHYFIASAQTYKGIPAELAGGKTYYVWITPRVGFLSAAVGFTAVSKGSDLLKEAKASMEPSHCRTLVPDKSAKYEAKKRGSILDALAEFKAGKREAEPGLKPEDGLDE